MPVPAGQSVGAVYLTIKNDSSEPDVLESATSADASTAEIQVAKVEGSGATLADAGPLTIAAGKSLVLTPNGYHLALQNLNRPLKVGDSVTVTLMFQRAAPVVVQVPVVTAAAALNEQGLVPQPPG